MINDRDTLPSQASGKSWEAWKCGGDPRESDMFSFAKPASDIIKRAGVVVAYAGTENNADLPREVQVPTGFRADLPA